MADRPIRFSGPEVRALMEGRKTQTRPVLKPQPDLRGRVDFGTILPGQRCVAYGTAVEVGTLRLPYAPGDRLWVKEAHRFIAGTGSHNWDGAYQYRADGAVKYGRWMTADEWGEVDPSNRWRPSIHMPRWASRLTLHVTEVRVQRLQDIYTDDALAEGIERNWRPGASSLELMAQGVAKSAFAALWNSLHGPDAWDQNPWVAAISFKVERANIDQEKETTDGDS